MAEPYNPTFPDIPKEGYPKANNSELIRGFLRSLGLPEDYALNVPPSKSPIEAIFAPLTRGQRRQAAEFKAQSAAQERQLAQYLESANRQRADYSIFDSIMRARRIVGMRSARSRGILTSPLGAPMDYEKKQLLGQ